MTDHASAPDPAGRLRPALEKLQNEWARRALALTSDRDVMRDDRIKAKALQDCSNDLAAVLREAPEARHDRRKAQRRSEANTPRSEAGPERRSGRDRRVVEAPEARPPHATKIREVGWYEELKEIKAAEAPVEAAAPPAPGWLTFTPVEIDQIMNALEGFDGIKPADDENRRKAAFEMIQDKHDKPAAADGSIPPGRPSR